MSYCRFSSDNWKCDVYALHSVFGYEINVAKHSYDEEPPEVPAPTKDNLQEWKQKRQEQMKWLEEHEGTPIGLPEDGKRYVYDNIDDFESRLRQLQDRGYYIPEYVFERIEQDK